MGRDSYRLGRALCPNISRRIPPPYPASCILLDNLGPLKEMARLLGAHMTLADLLLMGIATTTHRPREGGLCMP